ncbi:MAG: tRNA (adenosine(37)-N6)-threonylcarbamoyltransferase complex ATPase subunit type 1 TsaE [Christensenellaceae bacterium]|nr:tRNA (adenosine(37)-N6)-threonylcarbamoyltransferase complex ATPase subunit type 1 TsaE [Christensenellaceae bacterium]
MQKFLSTSPTQTKKVAQMLSENLRGGDVVLLNGGLGAGKTTFTQGLAFSLGVTKNVVSPTFTIIKEYYGRFRLFHIDMYRINNEIELDELGIDDCFSDDAIVVIEWNKAMIMEQRIISVEIDTLDIENRIITIDGTFPLEKPY